jgi:two-component system, cell cycle response regulator DivK
MSAASRRREANGPTSGPWRAPRPSAHARSSRRRARPRPVLLIADDSADAREIYATYFTRRGFDVVTCDNGAGAVEGALQHVPDVIVMDLAMPQFDGITATERIKANAQTRGTRVILLTGYPHYAIERGALGRGVDRFLTKPCLPQELERHVNELRRPRDRS